MDWLPVLLGIPIGIAANFCFQWIWAIGRWSTNRIDMSGYWAEKIISGDERQCSIGHIHYDFWRKRWNFDGTNYHNDGTPYCHWRTITSHLDRSSKVFVYVFINVHEASSEANYYGFGIVHLQRPHKRWVPVRGAFAAGNPGEAFRSHSMVKLESGPQTKEEVLKIFREKLEFSPDR